MYVIVSSSGDIEFLGVYGPYATSDEAQKYLPEDDDQQSWRVVELFDADELDDLDEE